VTFDRGPADEFEIVWRTGHVERLRAHQVSWEGGPSLFSRGPDQPQRVRFHGEVDGRWRLLLDALADDIVTIRNVSQVGDVA
jgi:hypothetical protein